MIYSKVINMKVKFKKLHPEAKYPRKAHTTDAGFDLSAISSKPDGDILTMGTGLAIEIPKGYAGLIFPRSSIFKTQSILSNSVGLIDHGFTGEITFKFYRSFENLEYKIGDRIGQLLIIPYPQIEFEEVNELSESERGTSGFGSSGK
jgi:dUTP pyrophosphatase